MLTLQEECAQSVLEAVPRVMRSVRALMRRSRGPDLTVPQFRVLTFVNRTPGASLSRVAQHVGTSLPSTSKLVDGLVGRGLVERQPAAGDRRRLALILTTRGASLLAAARKGTHASLVEILARASSAQQAVILEAMRILSGLFAPEEGL